MTREEWKALTPQARANHSPSIFVCVECGKPAGTPWSPYWCPDCDDIRIERISKSMDSILANMEKVNG